MLANVKIVDDLSVYSVLLPLHSAAQWFFALARAHGATLKNQCAALYSEKLQ